MYESFLLIDLGNDPDRPRPGRLWLRNRYHVHQRLCMAFPSTSRKDEDPKFLKPYKQDDFANGQVHVERSLDNGFLFRVDPLFSGRAGITVRSAVMPDWVYAFHNAEYLLAAPPEVKPFDPRFMKGQSLRFRLTANPTRRLSSRSPDAREESIGKRVPVPMDKLIDWLERKAELSGFCIRREATTFHQGYVYIIRKPEQDNGQRLRSVTFDGILQVTDPDAFRQVLSKGIGSGKGFGFGLLSVVPAHGEGLE